MSQHASRAAAYTFAFPLPFQIPLPSGFGWKVTDRRWAFAEPRLARMPYPSVTATFLESEEPIAGHVPLFLNVVVEEFYGEQKRDYLDVDALWDQDAARAFTWVSLETDVERLTQESPDPAMPGLVSDMVAMARCLEGLNAMLRAYITATFDSLVTQLTDRDIGNVIVMGERLANGEWRPRPTMFMNSEHWVSAQPIIPVEGTRHLAGRHWDEQWDHPFLRARTWKARAEFARFRQADMVNAIVSLNTSVEALVSDVLRMANLDLAESAATAASPSPPLPGTELFLARLIKTELPRILGGNWSTEPDAGTPCAAYFEDLYRVRNSVVHGGTRPDEAVTMKAFEAYEALRAFIASRLLERWRTYPRTVMTMLGEDLGGHPIGKSGDFVRVREEITSGPFPYWLPPNQRYPSQAHLGPTNWTHYPHDHDGT